METSMPRQILSGRTVPGELQPLNPWNRLDLPPDPGNNRPVTGASLSKPEAAEPSPASESGEPDDSWALLEGLRRRLDDQAAQNRKTQQQVSQLAESIGALVEVQRRRTRRLNLNSFIAYLIFTLLC